MECNRSSKVIPCRSDISAAVSLPTIATAESLCYMLRNVGDNDMLTDYVRVMSQDIDMLTANLQYRGQFNLFTD